MSIGALCNVAERDQERFEIIEGDAGEGFYVWRYDGNTCTHDYLQSDVEIAKRTAFDLWGVPPELWREALPGELPLWEATASQ